MSTTSPTPMESPADPAGPRTDGTGTNPAATAVAPITDEQVIALAEQVGRAALPFEDEHDRNATFVTEAYQAMRDNGYLTLAVPRELGGLGATNRQLILAQLELGRWSGAAALAVTMHTYLCRVQLWRMRRGKEGAEGALRKVVDNGLVMATSGGSDWVSPSTVAVEVEGGYRWSGRKTFCSQAPVAGSLSTSAVLGEPGPDAVVLHAGVPVSSAGIRIEETWDTLGMRGTASHDLVFEDVFVPAAAVIGTRPYGKLTGPLQVAVINFSLIAGATYLGVARGAADRATDTLTGRAEDRVAAVRTVGDMQARYRSARWCLLGAAEEIGEDPGADDATLATVAIAKRTAVLQARTIVDLALELAGGRSFFRSPLERAYRDVRGGPFHPLTPEATLDLAGRMRLEEVRTS